AATRTRNLRTFATETRTAPLDSQSIPIRWSRRTEPARAATSLPALPPSEAANNAVRARAAGAAAAAADGAARRRSHRARTRLSRGDRRPDRRHIAERTPCAARI